MSVPLVAAGERPREARPALAAGCPACRFPPPMVAEHDLSLVRRARTGDQEAFTLLVRRHQDRVWALVRSILRDEDDTADVVQETFLAVLRHLDSFRAGARFSTWLHSIAVRKAYDHLRRRRPVPMDPDTMPEPESHVAAAEQAAAEIRGDLLEALDSLDRGFRAAVLLVDVLGCSVDEAAESLGVAPGTVKSRVFRGRAMLAERLGTVGYDGASKE